MGREVTAAEMSALTKAARDLSRSVHNMTQVMKDSNHLMAKMLERFASQVNETHTWNPTGPSVEPHEHNPIQHRDGRPPWCNACGLTEGYQVPTDMFLKTQTKDENV